MLLRFAVKSRPVAEDPSLQDYGGELADLRVVVAARVREERGTTLASRATLRRVASALPRTSLSAASNALRI